MAATCETPREKVTVGEGRLRRLVLALAALVLGLLALGLGGGMWLYLVQTGHIHTGEALTVRVPDAEGMQPGAHWRWPASPSAPSPGRQWTVQGRS